MGLPQQKFEDGFEDTEDIDINIDNLYQRFIAPIDAIRSIAEAPPGKFQTNTKTISETNVDPVGFLESRCHAFYRMLGLPVVGTNDYYNPGFDPKPRDSKKRDAINQQVDVESMQYREQHYKAFQQLFAGQGLEAALWGLVQRLPKPFNMEDLISIDTKPKIKAIDGREEIIAELKKNIPVLALVSGISEDLFVSKIGYKMTSARHPILPLSVNPAIDFTVMPSDNKICVPFLPDMQSKKISSSPDVYLPAPGIEFILRARLKDDLAPDANALNLDENETKLFEELLSNNNQNVSIVILNQLIKTIKATIQLLYKSTNELDKVHNTITFLPIPDVKGFEFGGKLAEVPAITLSEKNLATLKIKKFLADRSIQFNQSLGNFATSEFIILQKTDTYSEQIQNLEREISDAGKKGLNNLKTIEIITGEASGFGLIDILSVYTALWAIKIEELLDLLDEDSFNRLYDNNVDLRTDAVVNRKNGSGNGVQNALLSLEKKINSILSFADLMFSLSYLSPRDAEGGDPT